MLGRRTMLALVLATTNGCDRCSGPEGPKDAAVLDVVALDAAPAPSAPALPRDASTPIHDVVPDDAGASSCRLVYGPAEQIFRGPAALVVSASQLQLVANDGGKPRLYSVPFGAPPPASVPNVPPAPLAASAFVGMRWPPCEVAGRWAYCQANGGLVYRTTLGGHDTKPIAKSKPSTRIAAAALGTEHAIVATLDVRHTTEGDRVQAFVTLDEGETVRLSEEGAGATVVRAVSRGGGAVALYLDARTSMVPVHARPLSLRGTDLALGTDAVVYVAGPPERAVEFAVAGTPNALFALLPIGRDSADFGMATIPIASEPRENVDPIWSMYPNGLDPAPIAATLEAEDGGWVARVRPAEREPGSPRVLELGRLASGGAFRSLGVIASGKPITDVAIARDGFGAVWILYGDTTATWLQRRVCR